MTLTGNTPVEAALARLEAREHAGRISAMGARAVNGGCEWNPVADELSYETDAHYREAPAEVLVGANGQYRLCSACAALPRFRRFKKRPIVRKPK